MDELDALLRKKPNVQVHPWWFLMAATLQGVLLFIIWLWRKFTRWA